MDVTEFERSLATDGYVAVPKEMLADTVVTDHSHAWDVRALVTSGQITLTIDTVATTYQSGDIFTMAADCIHHEQVGPNGVAYLVGRRDRLSIFGETNDDLTEEEAMAVAVEEVSASRRARHQL
jgi:quercetin dioxygenase-like cupin family protein